ncbi:MAG: hypothetical protein KatS3mg111_2192 [Pirellulaceae bacterium]|nr:MAG: hypothetical protein KatS3mg111_2192 [Pirellulaceae bacterium]
MIYESRVEELGTTPYFPQEVVRRERSQARTCIKEAINAGPVHRAFIRALPADWRADPQVEIFSRVLYLKRGWYPLTPHYHFDWGRHGGVNGSPVETIMVLNGEASKTEFILGPLEYPTKQPPDRSVSLTPDRDPWEELVNAGLRTGVLQKWILEPNKLIRFNSHTLHRARPAEITGWRVLIRAIRGLGKATPNPGRFTTCRNGFIPTTAEEQSRYQSYQL